MLEGGVRVVRRVDIDALHPPGIERQQRLEGLQVVTLNQDIARVRLPRRQVGHFFQQPIRHTGGGMEVFVSCQPVEGRH